MNEINVIYQFNEKYVPYAGVSMTSLFINNSDVPDINVYIFGEELSDSSIELLNKAAKRYGRDLIFPQTALQLNEFKKMGMIPYRGAYSVYLRLFFTQMVDLRGKRAVYLDSDTIINGSLLPLVNYDLGGKSIGMVLESIRDDYKVMIGMKPDSEYFNSGMILFDVDKWTGNRYPEHIVEHIQNVRSSYIGDQDFLNIVCEGDVCRLPMVYNYQPLHGRYTANEYFGAYPGVKEYYSPDEIDRARKGAVVYHCYRWLGEFPWNRGNRHPFNDLFDGYLKQSFWQGYIKKKADTGFALKVEKMLYIIFSKKVFIRIFKLAHERMLRKAEGEARRHKSNEIA